MSWWISSFSRLTKTIKSKKPAIHPKTRHYIMIMGAGPLETTSMQQPLSSAVVYLFSCSVCGEVSCCLQRFRGFYPLIIVSILFIMFCVIYFIFTSFPVLKIQIVQTFFLRVEGLVLYFKMSRVDIQYQNSCTMGFSLWTGVQISQEAAACPPTTGLEETTWTWQLGGDTRKIGIPPAHRLQRILTANGWTKITQIPKIKISK